MSNNPGSRNNSRRYVGFNERYFGRPSKPGNKQDAHGDTPPPAPAPPSEPTVFLQDPDVTLYHGDVLETLQGLPDDSVDCVITSPPYWGLRDYGTGSWEGGDADCDHSVGGQVQDTKAPGAITTGQRPGVDASRCRKCGATRVDQQLGLEPTPDAFVARMVEVFREVRRVLAPHGTCWVNLGDSYGTGSLGRNDADRNFTGGGGNKLGSGNPGRQGEVSLASGLKPKDLVGIPWRVAFALQADGWYLRADVIWSKPNPMPESVTDRPTKAHEYVFLLTKAPRYFFDQEAVREPHTGPPPEHYGVRATPKDRGVSDPLVRVGEVAVGKPREYHPNGRNIRSVWEMKQTGRPRGARHTLHDDYFAGVDTEPKAYWLGFLWADGYLGRRHVDVQLAEKDADHLALLQEALGSSRNVTISHDGRARFIASSLRMADDLRTLGMDTKQHVPLIDHSLVRHFMRGVFDGDGSAWKYLPTSRTRWRYGASFLGHMGVLERVRDDLGLRGKPKFSRGIHRLNVAAAADIARLYDYLYTDATVWLERKRAEFPQAQAVAHDVWPIATQPYPEAHFATYPEELVRRCLLAGCPEWVCRECGKPRERIVAASYDAQGRTTNGPRSLEQRHETAGFGQRLVKSTSTEGFTDCGHNDYRPGRVLDPFMGSGTTAFVARKHGRHAIGIDLSESYLELAARRLQQLSLFAEGAA